MTREGLTFGLISAGRVLVAFLASVTFLFTTLADDLLEALVAAGRAIASRSSMLSAVQMVPRMQAAPARSSRRSRRAGCRSTGRSSGASGRSCR